MLPSEDPKTQSERTAALALDLLHINLAIQPKPKVLAGSSLWREILRKTLDKSSFVINAKDIDNTISDERIANLRRTIEGFLDKGGAKFVARGASVSLVSEEYEYPNVEYSIGQKLEEGIIFYLSEDARKLLFKSLGDNRMITYETRRQYETGFANDNRVGRAKRLLRRIAPDPNRSNGKERLLELYVSSDIPLYLIGSDTINQKSALLDYPD